MRMDITVTGYPTYADLEHYMYGSAAVIGLQMVPILEPLPGREQEAADRAQALGEAFQLSNFIRDVGRGPPPRPGLPARRRTSTASASRRADLAPGPTPPHVVELLRFEIARTRALYATARPGIDLLHPTSRDCIRTAFALYGGILDAVEKADYQVLDRRVAVPLPRRLAVALPALVRARRARRGRRRATPAAG